ncbi:MAG: prolyl-tRNA synthetase associated domain-containing protein [Candidatus Dependentiae bacterium]|jgi:Ala-tRNA(Pro) deacylase
MKHKSLVAFFDEHNINHTIYEHEPVFTTEEDKGIEIEGAQSKNLFLRDKKKQHYFLISVLQHKRVDIKTLSKQLGHGNLSFGKPDAMEELLGVVPGSVTPYGLIHDADKRVRFLLDKDFLAHDILNFHPLRNDMTVSVARDDFLKFCEKVGNSFDCIAIPEL